MLEWLDSIAGPDFTRAIFWTIGALVLLVIVLVIVKLIRSMTFGTFVAGGRNRKTRLAVMDATAVDSHRRLVLIRRDDIEHLLLIGGPTDVVVERDIRLVSARRPTLTGEGPPPAPAAPRPRPPQQEAALVRQAPPPRQGAVPTPAPVAHPYPQMSASTPPPAYPAAQTPHAQPAYAAPSGTHAEDDALTNELAMSLDDIEPLEMAEASQAVRKSQPQSLDDEMTKLLGELSNHKK
jgi:hypothetical protein